MTHQTTHETTRQVMTQLKPCRHMPQLTCPRMLSFSSHSYLPGAIMRSTGPHVHLQ
jgi:hypothetical protein